jgi:DNA-3-methyladenine glycosylase
MAQKISKKFFNRSADIVAKDLLGKILVRKEGRKLLKAKIVETEAYFSEDDPASWAKLGKRKDNLYMWSEGGTILVKNVHMYFMLNFVVGKKGEAGAVLIRAVEPLNFWGRCSGPGLLSKSLKIDKSFNGKKIFEMENFFIEDCDEKVEVGESFRVGVKNDLEKHFRFYIKNNEFVSGKNNNRI